MSDELQHGEYVLGHDRFIRRAGGSKILGRASGYPGAHWYQIAASVIGAKYDPPSVDGYASLEDALAAAVNALEARRVVTESARESRRG